MNPWSTVYCLTKQALPPLHPNISMHILYADPSLSYSNDKENLFHNQEPLQLVTISFSLKTLNVFI